MLNKFLILAIVMTACLAFIFLGLPVLKSIKNADNEKTVDLITMDGLNLSGGRVIVVDLSVESPCTNLMTEEPLEKCQSPQGCNTVCRLEGCESFGLQFVNSSYSDRRCSCTCFEENKIKKALNP